MLFSSILVPFYVLILAYLDLFLYFRAVGSFKWFLEEEVPAYASVNPGIAPRSSLKPNCACRFDVSNRNLFWFWWRKYFFHEFFLAITNQWIHSLVKKQDTNLILVEPFLCTRNFSELFTYLILSMSLWVRSCLLSLLNRCENWDPETLVSCLHS